MDPAQYLTMYGPARQPEQQWSPVSATKILRAARKQHGKSAGLDGWSGTAVAMWPSNIWSDAFGVGNLLATSRRVGERSCKSAVPAGKLRPISVLPVFWRTYIAAHMDEDAVHNWLDGQLHPSQARGRRGRDASSSFVSVAVCDEALRVHS